MGRVFSARTSCGAGRVMSSGQDTNTIVITAVGMVTSLGLDCITSCAAYRGGFSGGGEFEDFKVLNEEDRSVENVCVHQVPMITNGFEGYTRMLRMGNAALEDLFAEADRSNWDFERTALYLALPDYLRVDDRISDPTDTDQGDRREVNEDERLRERRRTVRATGHTLCRRLAESTDCAIPESRWKAFGAGHAGVSFAIEHAAKDLVSRDVDRCIVGGLDSLLDLPTLQWLQDSNRLKTEENPVGFQPGEAAAFLLLETCETALQRKCDILATLASTATEFEPDHFFTGKPPVGQGIARAIEQLVTASNGRGFPRAWMITDQNGEPYRATEWGHLVVRLAAEYPTLADAVVWMPATAYGDTGAASGAVAACAAVRAFARQYAPGSQAIIASSSDRGERGAFCLTGIPNK